MQLPSDWLTIALKPFGIEFSSMLLLEYEKKELFIVLPYLVNFSLALRRRLHNSINYAFK